MSVGIRAEEAGDVPGIRDVNATSFGREDEARLVDGLREEGYARLSLVAEEGGRLVGHIMFSEAVIRTVSDALVGALALGPVGVIPERQGRGVGSALVREGLDRCARAGHSIVVLLGHPGYYPRFGFSAERAGNLSSPYSGVVGEFEFAPPLGSVS